MGDAAELVVGMGLPQLHVFVPQVAALGLGDQEPESLSLPGRLLRRVGELVRDAGPVLDRRQHDAGDAPLLAAQTGNRPVDPLLQLLGLLFAVDGFFGVGIIDARHIDAAVPLVEPADGGVEAARGDDGAGRMASPARLGSTISWPHQENRLGTAWYGSPLSCRLPVTSW